MSILFQKHQNDIILKLLHSFLHFIRTTEKYFMLCNWNYKNIVSCKNVRENLKSRKFSTYFLHIIFFRLIFFYYDFCWCKWRYLCIYFLYCKIIIISLKFIWSWKFHLEKKVEIKIYFWGTKHSFANFYFSLF